MHGRADLSHCRHHHAKYGDTSVLWKREAVAVAVVVAMVVAVVVMGVLVVARVCVLHGDIVL